MLVYTTLALLLQHTGGRSRRSSWLTCFIVSDVMFIGVAVGLITVLARAGLPSMCVGLTNGDRTFFLSLTPPGHPAHIIQSAPMPDQTNQAMAIRPCDSATRH